MWLLIAFRQLASPSATNFLNLATNTLTGLLVGVYLLFSLITLSRQYLRTPGAERAARGLSLLFWGALAGLAPLIVGSVIQAIPANNTNPAADFLFLSLAFIPLSWTAAVRSKDALR